MALTDKIKAFINSPKGQQAIRKGREELAKPENQRKIKNIINTFSKKR